MSRGEKQGAGGSEGASRKHRNKVREEPLLQVIDSSIHFRYTKAWETGRAPYREKEKIGL